MESPNLSETRPTPLESGGQTIPETGGAAPGTVSTSVPGGNASATQPMPAPAPLARIQLDPGETVEQPSEPSAANEPPSVATQPMQVNDGGINLPPEIPAEPPETHRRGKRWILWAVLGVLALALIAGGSVYAGYSSAVDQRIHNQSTLVANEAANQYVQAQQDIALGNYDRARQRLEFIIQLDPNYPGVSEQLAYVLTQQRITATPTLAPSPTVSPTPDFRSRDDLFNQAQTLLVGRDWSGTIDTLLQLRKNYPDFMAVKVDDMLFVALRNRGIDKIAQQHDLEGGNYDLSLAERFGPLDTEANNWRAWAEMYIRGASFWDVDWGQAVFYFSQLASAAPNLSDASNWTAANRYMDALLGYGDWFAAKSQWCDAQQQYDTYMSLLASPQVEPTAVFAADQCSKGVGPSETPGGPTLTPGGPELTPTPEVTPSP